jgi:hypothetical protein
MVQLLLSPAPQQHEVHRRSNTDLDVLPFPAHLFTDVTSERPLPRPRRVIILVFSTDPRENNKGGFGVHFCMSPSFTGLCDGGTWSSPFLRPPPITEPLIFVKATWLNHCSPVQSSRTNVAPPPLQGALGQPASVSLLLSFPFLCEVSQADPEVEPLLLQPAMLALQPGTRTPSFVSRRRSSPAAPRGPRSGSAPSR